jgi:hypothetical protein
VAWEVIEMLCMIFASGAPENRSGRISDPVSRSSLLPLPLLAYIVISHVQFKLCANTTSRWDNYSRRRSNTWEEEARKYKASMPELQAEQRKGMRGILLTSYPYLLLLQCVKSY